MEVIFIFGQGMYFQTGQVIFVPEWPKGEFVSILASFWTKSLVCKDTVNRDSTIQSTFRRLYTA
jgi:predicted RNA-binding protein with TRAM domain